MHRSDASLFSESNFSEGRKSRRYTERLETSLPVRARGRESYDHEWSEKGLLLDVSRSGARLTLAHKVELGQLIQLTAPMPVALRLYDQAENDYRIWGLVRTIIELPRSEVGKPKFEIGVAFVGKTPPPSYKTNPRARYEPLPAPGRDGLWAVREMPREKDRGRLR